MKGYSFDELVKLAMAAVKRAGDTMTGNLTAPAVLVSSAQNTSANALTRKDYVDTELSKKLSLTGGTVTGNLVVSADGAAKAQIYAEGTSAMFSMHDGSGAVRGNFHYDRTSEVISINTYDASGTWVSQILGANLSPAGPTAIRNPTSQNAQGSLPASLTRKDYVDTTISDRLRASAITADSSLPANGKYPSHLRFMEPAVVTLDETWPDGSRLCVIVDHGVDMAAGDCIVQLISGTISTSIGADRQIRLRQASREFIFEKIAGQWRAA